MAIAQTVHRYRGRRYCLLIDPQEDSLEVVFESGFEVASEDTEPVGFAPAYFVDALPGPGLPFEEIRLRLHLETDEPLGLGLEHYSKQVGRHTTLAGLPALLRLAHNVSERHMGSETLFPEPAGPPVTQEEGRYVVYG